MKIIFSFFFFSNYEGHSPLAIAYDNNQFEIADFLASNGAEFNEYEIVESPLIYASKFGNLERVKQYISEGIDVNVRDSDNKTSLMHALDKISENNNYNFIVNLLIDKGADINLKYEGNTSLHMAIKGKSDIKFIEKLISAGFDVNSINIPFFYSLFSLLTNSILFISLFSHRKHSNFIFMNFNQTPLHIACENGNKEIVEFLISKGADVNAVDYILNTPLHIACSHNYFEIIELLISNGAEIMCYNENNAIPLHKACENNNSNRAVNLLLSKGSDVNFINNAGISSTKKKK